MAITKEVLNELLKDYKGPDDLTGPDGLLKELTKALVERAMEAEMTEQLGYEKNDQAEKGTSDRRNGKTKKTLRSDQGPLEIEIPRDREGEFAPAIVPKHQREFKGFDDKILSMYARGMTTREIAGHLKEIYGTEVSPELISLSYRLGERMAGRLANTESRQLLSDPVSGCVDDQRQGRREGSQEIDLHGIGDQ